jgi:hypothetical protein
MNEFFGELSMNIEIENSGVVYFKWRNIVIRSVHTVPDTVPVRTVWSNGMRSTSTRDDYLLEVDTTGPPIVSLTHK